MNHSAQQAATILIVDNDRDRIDLLSEALRSANLTKCSGITDPNQVVEAFLHSEPDVVILELHTSPLDGFQVLGQLRALTLDTDYLPILVLSSDAIMESREQALEAGATDFVSQPFTVAEVVLRVKNLLHARRLHLALADRNRTLDHRVRERTAELESLQEELLHRLARAAEYHDDATGEHTRRVGEMSRSIALELGVSQFEAEQIGTAAQLHDIGKIGIPDAIMRKPGKLTPEEFDVIKTHTAIGGNILSGSKAKLLQIAETIALTHHEWWDGRGYSGMVGHEIPLCGRIVAVADVFDALTHHRCYKKAWPVDEAIAEIRAGSGTQFDPHVVEAFLRVLPRHVSAIVEIQVDSRNPEPATRA